MKNLLLNREEVHLLRMERMREEGKEALLETASSLRVKAQNMENTMSMYVRDEETEEELREKKARYDKYCMSYAKEHKIKNELDELTLLIAEQHMDNCKDITSKGEVKEKSSVRVHIQKRYIDDSGSKEVWFNLTAKDLGLGLVHKVERNGYEFRVPHIFNMDVDQVIKKSCDGHFVDTNAVVNGLSEKSFISYETNGVMSYRDEYENYLWYIAGGHGEPIEIDGENYRVVISHPELSKVIGIDYNDEFAPSTVELSDCVIGVQPKEKFAADYDKYKENSSDSSEEIMFGRANDVILGVTQLFYSEWEERKKEFKEKSLGKDISKRERVMLNSKLDEVKDSPYYMLILQLNHLAESGMTKELSKKISEIKGEADEILAYARENKKFVYLIANKEDFRLSPYTLVKVHATRIEKKRKIDGIDEAVKLLVRELKETHNLELITEDNAESILEAARAGGECRFDKEHKAIYLHVRDLVNNIA